ncbi:MAG TPA: sulfatase-like hydrolase/transferase, partial [Agriterribacter sp.]|nr:sulfatase-like hydrolase/transferase [Agriterribacter sp.]
MKKICFSSLLLIVLLTTGFYRAIAQQKKLVPPNIIFILADDMGYGDIGAFYQDLRKQKNDRSEPWMSTPNLDKLATSGVMLTEHYCGAPVCAPSRASLFSGLSQGHANVRDNQFDKALADNYTLGNIMQKAGYVTAAIGKWGLQGEVNGEEPNWPAYPLKRGFDYFLGYVRHRDRHEHYPKEGLYREKKQVWENDKNITSVLDKCYTGDLWTAAAKRWIVKQHQKNKNIPFFLYLGFDTPHATLELPTQQYPSGSGLKGGMQWLDEPGHMITTASGVPDSWIHPDYINATWDDDKNAATPEVAWPETYKRYATAIRRIDDQVGDLMQLLSDLDIDKNTMLVFTSDNGPSQESYLPKEYVSNEADFFNSFGPFDGIKRDVWEGGVRVPTIVVWPSHIKSSWKIKAPSAFYDWLPTFANAAGQPAPAFSDGQTL